VHERRAEHRGRCLDGGDTRDDDDFDIPVQQRQILSLCCRSVQQLQHQAGHAVDTGIAAGDQRGNLAGSCQSQRRFAALDLLHHSRGDDLFAGKQRRDEIEIGLVADHCRRRFKRLPCLQSHMIQSAGTDADDVQFCHENLEYPC